VQLAAGRTLLVVEVLGGAKAIQVLAEHGEDTALICSEAPTLEMEVPALEAALASLEAELPAIEAELPAVEAEMVEEEVVLTGKDLENWLIENGQDFEGKWGEDALEMMRRSNAFEAEFELANRELPLNERMVGAMQYAIEQLGGVNIYNILNASTKAKPFEEW